MSPIRPENRARYPLNWDAISHRIRFDRAQGRCECVGECGLHPPVHIKATNVGWEDGALVPRRCTETHGKYAKWARGKVVLTVAHLDHTPENCADTNLKAMCQRCHLLYDKDHHAKNSAKTRAVRAARQSEEKTDA